MYCSQTQALYKRSSQTISKWIVEPKHDEAPQYFDFDGQLDLTVFSPTDFESILIEMRSSAYASTLNVYRISVNDLYRK